MCLRHAWSSWKPLPTRILSSLFTVSSFKQMVSFMIGHLHQRKVTLLQLVKPMCRLGLWTSRQLLLKTHYLLKMLISLSERKIKFTAFSLHLEIWPYFTVLTPNNSRNSSTNISFEKFYCLKIIWFCQRFQLMIFFSNVMIHRLIEEAQEEPVHV